MRTRMSKCALAALLALGMALGLAACSGNAEDGQTTPPQSTQPGVTPGASEVPKQPPEPTQESKILIAYFSLWDNAPWGEATDTDSSASVVVEEAEAIGTNGYVARMIQSVVGGDIHVIRAAESYPADFDGVVEQNHQENSRALSGTVDNMERYDTVFIGYPVWATTLPQAVRTFLTEYDFTGKTVIPFCTHDGYGAGSTFATVSELAAGAETLEGIAIEAKDVPSAQSTVEQWLGNLGLSGSVADSQGETPIRITVGDVQLDGAVYDTAEARQFLALLPQAISMTNYGGREVYGGLDGTITVEGEGQLRFDNGDITYCPSNNTAAIFYAQTDRPNLTMEVYPVGRVTSDLTVFGTLDSRVKVTFEPID